MLRIYNTHNLMHAEIRYSYIFANRVMIMNDLTNSEVSYTMSLLYNFYNTIPNIMFYMYINDIQSSIFYI